MAQLESSPSTAEAYFNGTIFGHLYTLFAETLAHGSHPGRPGVGEADVRGPEGPPGTRLTASKDRDAAGHDRTTPARPFRRRRSLFDWLDGWFWRQALKEREAYLARAVDAYDLERRITALQRAP